MYRKCPIDENCKKLVVFTDQAINKHLIDHHKNIGPKKRTRIRMRLFGDNQEFTSARTEEEKHLVRQIDIK